MRVGWQQLQMCAGDRLMSTLGSVKQAASTVAAGMVQFYTGGVEGQVVSQIPGLLPGPYYVRLLSITPLRDIARKRDVSFRHVWLIF